MDTKQLEKSLEDVYKNAPALPQSAKKLIVEWLPWANLIIGILSLFAAYSLWRWAHTVNRWAELTNTISAAYGNGDVVSSRMTVMVWASLIVLAVEAVVCILAFSPLKERKMAGWRLLFYVTLVNVAYGLVNMFTDYGGAGSFIGSVIGSAIGLYFLFQIKGEYEGKKVTASESASKAPEAPKK